MDEFKLWYSGGSRNWNGAGILVDKDLKKQVVKVRRVNDEMMMIKLVVGGLILNIISVYAPQVGLDEEVVFLGGLGRGCERYSAHREAIRGRRFQWSHRDYFREL